MWTARLPPWRAERPGRRKSRPTGLMSAGKQGRSPHGRIGEQGHLDRELGADPEIRHTQDGRPIVNLRVATSESWRDKASGERKETTEWHRVVIFNEGLCRIAEQYLKKGSKIYLEGQLQTRKWQDQSGQERYSTEVVLQGFNSQLTMLDGTSGRRRRGAGERRRLKRRFRPVRARWRGRRPVLRQGARRRDPVLAADQAAPFQATGPRSA